MGKSKVPGLGPSRVRIPGWMNVAQTLSEEHTCSSSLRMSFLSPAFAGLSVQGSLADAVKHNGSAVLRKWGELTLNPHPDATGCTKRNAQAIADEFSGSSPRLSPGRSGRL